MKAGKAATFELLTSPSARRLLDEAVARVLSLSGAAPKALATSGARPGPAARPSEAGVESIVVVAPTVRLLDALKDALLRAAPRGILAGVHFLHHGALATQLLARASVLGIRELPAPRLLSSLEAEALARAAVASLPASSSLRRLCEDRPRFVASLRRTLAELREACVSPEALARELGAAHDLARLHAAHDALLDSLARRGHAGDAAFRALEAAEAAAELGRRGLLPWSRLVHHGSYELVGVHAALVGAVADSLPTIMLAPCGEGPAQERARRGLACFPGDRARPVPLDPPERVPTLLDVGALCDEDAAPERVRLPAQAVLEAFHVRGARAEVELAARLAADAHLSRGVPLEEIAVIARSLEPVAAHLEAAFAAQGLPFVTSATAPLLREPWARAAATLLDVLAAGLPRPLVAEFLRSPWTRLDDEAGPSAITPDLWDEWSLAARVMRGAESLRDDVLAWHEADLRERALRRGGEVEGEDDTASAPWALARRERIVALGRIAMKLEEDRQAWLRCRSHAEHARELRRILARWLREPEAGAAVRAQAILLGILDDLSRLDAIRPLAGDDAASGPGGSPARAEVHANGNVDAAEIRRLVGDALAAAALPMGGRDGDGRDGAGVRVLSAMPARALPFREVILLGFTQGSFPRRARHDPFLGDDVRMRLRRAAPALGVKREAREEERQILALLLGAATERIHVAWQRADEDGSARAPSLFLREIARLTLGSPDLDAIVSRRPGHPNLEVLAARLPVTSVPGHPALAAAVLRERFKRTSLPDALVEAAERPQRRRAVEALLQGASPLGALGPDLAAGLAALRLGEAFRLETDPQVRRRQLALDGLLEGGVVPMPGRLSASALQAFGRCSLQWLFSRHFGIPQRADEPDPAALGADELGTCVHAALEAVNRHAIANGGNPDQLISTEALGVLRATWEREVAALAGSRRAHAPLAWDVLSRLWLGALEGFLEADARRLQGMRATIVHAELDLEETVEIPGSPPLALPLRGRADRIVRWDGGWQVHDFKTSANADRHVDKATVLKGRSLQGLTYLLLLRAFMARTQPGVEGHASVVFMPVFPPDGAAEPQPLEIDEYADSWAETLRVLASTWQAGAFAFKKGGCAWCDFRAACRVEHAPTRARQLQVNEWSDYLALEGKSTRALSLADVRARAGGRSAEDES